MATHDTAIRRALIATAAAGAGLGLASAGGWLGAAVYLAKVLLTPEKEREDDVVVVAADDTTVTLEETPETLVPGRYGLWLDRGRGYARVGQILSRDHQAHTLTRELLAVDAGRLRPGPARWSSQFYYGDPAQEFGLHTDDVDLDGQYGPLPSWVVPAPSDPVLDQAPGGAPPGRWAILVHGRGATRHECLRAVPLLHRLGLTCLIPSYRNDGEAPPSPDGLYNLGLTEWRDIDVAIRYALDHGADDLVLMGWSMGGAIVLQTLDQSPNAAEVSQVVLDSPVIDWVDVIAHHGKLRKVPGPLTLLSQSLIGTRWAGLLVGTHERLDLARTSWQTRADELRHPILLLHSVDDDFVPVGPSRRLADDRPDLVTWSPWARAGHVKEWNLDPDRWEREVGEFLTSWRPGTP